ncbi:MAG: histidine kinase [Crocinitomicaceae bacterium]|nr:histidine kinase [Crocinitomicaceae bacterium]
MNPHFIFNSLTSIQDLILQKIFQIPISILQNFQAFYVWLLTSQIQMKSVWLMK